MQREKGTLRGTARGKNFPEQVPAGLKIREGQFPGGQGGVAGQVEQHRLIFTGAKEQSLSEEA